jgi:hypothetical protein
MSVETRVSALDPSGVEKVQILVAILQQNREEVRFWQERLFAASFWFNATTLGVVAFVLKEPATATLQAMAAFGCVCLSAFHFIIAVIAKKAIETTGSDLVRIQSALLLTRNDSYMQGGRVYQDSGKWLPQYYIWWLVGLNVLLCVVSVIALLWH